MTETRKEVCCPGNGLSLFAVGAEVFLDEIETMASEMKQDKGSSIFVRSKGEEIYKLVEWLLSLSKGCQG